MSGKERAKGPHVKRKLNLNTNVQVFTEKTKKKKTAVESTYSKQLLLTDQNMQGKYLPKMIKYADKKSKKVNQSVRKGRNNNAKPVLTTEMITRSKSNQIDLEGVTNFDKRMFKESSKLSDIFLDSQEIDHDGVEVNADIRPSDDEYNCSEDEDDVESDTKEGEIPSTITNAVDDEAISDGEPDNEVVLTDKKNNLRVQLKRDPQLREMFKELVDERIEKLTGNTVKGNSKNNGVEVVAREQSKAETPIRNKSPVIKSPSDTTIYTPALKKGREQDNLINKISNFVESIRLESQRNSPAEQDTRNVIHQNRDVEHTSDPPATPEPCTSHRSPVHGTNLEEQTRVRDRTDKLILDAEKLKANLVAPQGMMLPIAIDSNIKLLRNLDNDDNFFHVTCHIDTGTSAKIEKGDFVDLEKLLPNEKAAGGYAMDETPGIKLITKGGHTYLAPPPGDKRITNLRKWDVAFRVYATIYSDANPERASEILQYIHVIHTAANTYNWDNVAFYDFMFRRLMASKPWRSWSKTYSQGWNLALKEPVVRSHGSGNHSNSNNSFNSGSKQRTWKDDCCWRYNRNNKCNKGKECSWDHRCNFCSGWNHGYFNCRKRLGRQQNGRKSGGGNPPTATVTSINANASTSNDNTVIN